jgi:hypothetical protein
MATTYSLGITGVVAGQSANKQWDIPDASVDGNVSATAGGMQGTMRTGDVMLVKGPDGAQHLYRFDAERSTPSNPVLIFVGP